MMRFLPDWVGEGRTRARCWPQRGRHAVLLQRLGVFVVAVVMLTQPSLALADQPVEVVSAAHVARIKDLTSVEGVRDNMLIGYG